MYGSKNNNSPSGVTCQKEQKTNTSIEHFIPASTALVSNGNSSRVLRTHGASGVLEV
jgi:hypothetical protein